METNSTVSKARSIKVTGPPRSASDTYRVYIVGEATDDVRRFWRALGIPSTATKKLNRGEAVEMLLTPHVWYEVVLTIDISDLPIWVVPVESKLA